MRERGVACCTCTRAAQLAARANTRLDLLHVWDRPGGGREPTLGKTIGYMATRKRVGKVVIGRKYFLQKIIQRVKTAANMKLTAPLFHKKIEFLFA